MPETGTPSIIDLRSDTVTLPGEGMREAMFSAALGDDVFGEDPTVNELESRAAALFGMEAALFCPSGTMTNQIAMKLHAGHMTEVILEEQSHTYLYEVGGIAFLTGASVRLLKGDRGRITAEQVLANIQRDNIHVADTRLVSLENTHNKGGGSIYNFSDILNIHRVCKDNGLNLHLDGARIFNALVETPENPEDYGRVFDTLSVCLSKGLGAPAGSLLLGSKSSIQRARKIRKALGGGMRQAGLLAAAGLYALKFNISRLKEDHQRAKHLRDILLKCSWVDGLIEPQTNILIFTLKSGLNTARFLSDLSEKGIRAVAFGGQSVRMVTHLNFDDMQLDRTADILLKFRPS